jgi:hypothetical protein
MITFPSNYGQIIDLVTLVYSRTSASQRELYARDKDIISIVALHLSELRPAERHDAHNLLNSLNTIIADYHYVPKLYDRDIEFIRMLVDELVIHGYIGDPNYIPAYQDLNFIYGMFAAIVLVSFILMLLAK